VGKEKIEFVCFLNLGEKQEEIFLFDEGKDGHRLVAKVTRYTEIPVCHFVRNLKEKEIEKIIAFAKKGGLE
jgi:hypothetical protein